MTSQVAEVNVVGSANIDLMVRVERLPKPGETLSGDQFMTVPGGKGANQAVAIARLGGHVRLIAKLGHDDFGSAVLDGLRAVGVDTASVLIDASAPTGIAMITVDESGENTIVVAPGSNALLTPADTAAGHPAKVLLAQLEIDPLAVWSARSNHLGLFVLNPAPAKPLSAQLLASVDVLTPNETECEALCGVRPADRNSTREACARLLAAGVKHVVITLGREGCVLANDSGIWRYPAMEVEAVDATGAGDAFNGGLALFLARGRSIDEAVRLAGGAGSLAVTKFGAQASMPTMEELEAAEQNLPSRTAL
jgi:ribokinase